LDEHGVLSNSELTALEWVTLEYYIHQVNPENGLVADKTSKGAPASIAAVGMALTTAPFLVERGLAPRDEVVQMTLTRLRFFRDSPQGPEPDATGYKGFYYHFLDMKTGRRVGGCALSTVDSAFLLAGMLAVATYFNRETADEHEVRTLADALYRRVDWRWAQNGEASLTHGWTPEEGFLPHRWRGYDEALLLYVLGLGSPTYPLPEESYSAWASTYTWRSIYDQEFLYSGPLFTHQFSHIWLDFRGIQDAFMRDRGIDYFENSRRATYIQREYAIRNPMEFEGYGANCWGITASDGPGWTVRKIDGIERHFFDYIARGAPYGPDDGTIAPWAVVASLPFAPEIVLPTIKSFMSMDIGASQVYGFRSTFNQTYKHEESGQGWVSPYRFGIDQGPIVLMIENYRSGLLWKLMRRCPYVIAGLRRANFTNGWL
jgi:hypothetical protein